MHQRQGICDSSLGRFGSAPEARALSLEPDVLGRCVLLKY